MDEDINDILDQVILNYRYNEEFNSAEFESLLAEYGYMIVPIEDPTNLRFGIDE